MKKRKCEIRLPAQYLAKKKIFSKSMHEQEEQQRNREEEEM